MTKETFKDVIAETVKASPPVAVVTAGLTQGWTLNQALTILTIFYVLLQIAWLVWRWYQVARQGVDSEIPVIHAMPKPKKPDAHHE